MEAAKAGIFYVILIIVIVLYLLIPNNAAVGNTNDGDIEEQDDDPNFPAALVNAIGVGAVYSEYFGVAAEYQVKGPANYEELKIYVSKKQMVALIAGGNKSMNMAIELKKFDELSLCIFI